MAWQIDEDYSPLLANRSGTKDESGVGKCNDFCEARSKFFDRFQMPWKGSYELEHASLCKHSHMPISKGKILLHIFEFFFFSLLLNCDFVSRDQYTLSNMIFLINYAMS